MSIRADQCTLKAGYRAVDLGGSRSGPEGECRPPDWPIQLTVQRLAITSEDIVATPSDVSRAESISKLLRTTGGPSLLGAMYHLTGCLHQEPSTILARRNKVQRVRPAGRLAPRRSRNWRMVRS